MGKQGKGQHTFKVNIQSPSRQNVSPQPLAEKHNDLRAARSYKFVINQGNPASLSRADSSSSITSASTDSASQQFVFTANKTTVGFTERREQKPHPPAPKRRKTNKYPHDDKLAINIRKPIKAFIPIDAWALIFRRCHPRFLISARLVCRDFHDILTTQSIWRDARQHSFDALTTMGCPPPLNEMQYTNLLVGRGCQIKSCTRRDTRKIYWPFMRRICETCLAQHLGYPEKDSVEAKAYFGYRRQLDPEVRMNIPEQLMDLLPAGSMWLRKWAEPRRLNESGQIWEYDHDRYCVIDSDYERLKEEFAANIMTDPSSFLSWAEKKWRATKDRMKIARTLSALDWDTVLGRGSNRDEKEQYFAEMAADLKPPMSLTVLRRMAAYNNVLDNGNAPSLRSWDLLTKKIDNAQLRAQAEQLIKWERSSDRTFSLDEGRDEDFLHDILYKHRNFGLPAGPPKLRQKKRAPEQEVIIQIAHEELDGLLDIVHDEDVLLVLLNNVRKSYEALEFKPVGLNGDGTKGEYRLLLDDARMVVNEVLMPRIAQECFDRRTKIVSSLRCMGCTRHDANRLDTFEQLVIHVRNTHAKYVGQDMHFWKWAVPLQTRFRRSKDQVAWYHIPWPKSMPALPAHRKATKEVVWNPNEEQDYIEHPVEEEIDLFDGLEASSDSKITAEDFTGNFCKAVALFSDTRLDSRSTMTLALEYAARRNFQRLERPLSTVTFLKFQTLDLATVKLSTDFKFKIKCGLCILDGQSNYHIADESPQHLASASLHWHNNKIDDALADVISLPSDRELHRTITELDAKLHAQKRRAETKGRKLAVGDDGEMLGKRDPRSAALLAIPSIQSRFDELFVRRQLDSEAARVWSEQETYSPEEDLAGEWAT
ncbi:hypothetical protein PMZ80_004368 [Knufia obscura]|uniref:F-box domain-containing protein n=2 Tax=Knufia TaxID=430999 RepID=A0AAN8E7S3_9EURO|nr:hypothetical protein PMZ80_004368 [Knufia obscura]KAK5948164.1 hypothetical protein OHC33_010817 [Knufia fluminis]